MKFLIITAVLFAGFDAHGQLVIDKPSLFLTDSLRKQDVAKSNRLGILGSADFSHVTPDGSSVYLLPQDKMPCVVPEQSNTMPVLGKNALKRGAPGSIPNPTLQKLSLNGQPQKTGPVQRVTSLPKNGLRNKAVLRKNLNELQINQ